MVSGNKHSKRSQWVTAWIGWKTDVEMTKEGVQVFFSALKENITVTSLSMKSTCCVYLKNNECVHVTQVGKQTAALTHLVLLYWAKSWWPTKHSPALIWKVWLCDRQPMFHCFHSMINTQKTRSEMLVLRHWVNHWKQIPLWEFCTWGVCDFFLIGAKGSQSKHVHVYQRTTSKEKECLPCLTCSSITKHSKNLISLVCVSLFLSFQMFSCRQSTLFGPHRIRHRMFRNCSVGKCTWSKHISSWTRTWGLSISLSLFYCSDLMLEWNIMICKNKQDVPLMI